ncbi:hypothetical protein LINGRAHAP2_LOCUS4911 [Linum grandiflorum]
MMSYSMQPRLWEPLGENPSGTMGENPRLCPS